nr:putative reverse transcriptase domain-containing protein [Tanacetum cinerariifolium]
MFSTYLEMQAPTLSMINQNAERSLDEMPYWKIDSITCYYTTRPQKLTPQVQAMTQPLGIVKSKGKTQILKLEFGILELMVLDGEYDAGGDDDNVTSIIKLDVSHPLHLHPNESVALTVVSIKLKGTKNNQVWSCAMSAYVIISSEESHKIATGSVSGTSQRPNDSGNRRIVGGSTLVCENCGFNSHTIDRCFKIIGYPADFRKRKERWFKVTTYLGCIMWRGVCYCHGSLIGGAEAILHSVNRVLSEYHNDRSLAMLTVDFSNAFNLVDRSTLLHEQGDPLRPLLFALILHPLLHKIKDSCKLLLHAWYLDDGTVIVDSEEVARELDIIK